MHHVTTTIYMTLYQHPHHYISIKTRATTVNMIVNGKAESKWLLAYRVQSCFFPTCGRMTKSSSRYLFLPWHVTKSS